jgi:hypothetical protein
MERIQDDIVDGIKRMRQELTSLNAFDRNLVLDLRVLCLSEIKDSLLMWSHYAANHTGAVIEFRYIPTLDNCLGAAKAVRYETMMPALATCPEDMVSVAFGEKSLRMEDEYDKLFLTKSAEWSYEKEWRIIWHSREKVPMLYDDYPFNPLEISSICLGCKMSDENRTDIRNLISHDFRHVHLLQAEKDALNFKLNFSVINYA